MDSVEESTQQHRVIEVSAPPGRVPDSTHSASSMGRGIWLPLRRNLAAVLAVLAVLVRAGRAVRDHAGVAGAAPGLRLRAGGAALRGARHSCSRTRRNARPPRRRRAADRTPFVLPLRWELLLLAGVIGVAVFFRFFRFSHFPPGIWYDESVIGTDALSIIDKDHLTVWRDRTSGARRSTRT